MRLVVRRRFGARSLANSLLGITRRCLALVPLLTVASSTFVRLSEPVVVALSILLSLASLVRERETGEHGATPWLEVSRVAVSRVALESIESMLVFAFESPLASSLADAVERLVVVVDDGDDDDVWHRRRRRAHRLDRARARRRVRSHALHGVNEHQSGEKSRGRKTETGAIPGTAPASVREKRRGTSRGVIRARERERHDRSRDGTGKETRRTGRKGRTPRRIGDARSPTWKFVHQIGVEPPHGLGIELGLQTAAPSASRRWMRTLRALCASRSYLLRRRARPEPTRWREFRLRKVQTCARDTAAGTVSMKTTATVDLSTFVDVSRLTYCATVTMCVVVKACDSETPSGFFASPAQWGRCRARCNATRRRVPPAEDCNPGGGVRPDVC